MPITDPPLDFTGPLDLSPAPLVDLDDSSNIDLKPSFSLENDSKYINVPFPIPDHLKPVLGGFQPGFYTLPVIVYSAQLYSFVPQGQTEKLEGCSLLYTDNVYEIGSQRVGFSFKKQSLPQDFFQKFQNLPKVAVFVYKIPRSPKEKSRLAKVFL